MSKTKDGVFPKKCHKCFYKSKHGERCYIKPRAVHACAAFTPRNEKNVKTDKVTIDYEQEQIQF